MEEGDVELGHVDGDADNIVQRLLRDVPPKWSTSDHTGSIYMVPKVYRDISPRSYTPQVVSIGPLHHRDTHLREFEKTKANYLYELLCHLRAHDHQHQIIGACVMKVSRSLDRIKACYKTESLGYSNSDLVEMMVMDACFILAFLYTRVGRTAIHIFRDMLLIENQIPFFVLQDVFDCTLPRIDPTLSLIYDLIFPFLKTINIFDEYFGTSYLKKKIGSSSSAHDHILGLLHKCYQNPDLNPDHSSSHHKLAYAHSAVKLDGVGVRFSKKLNAKWPMAMELESSRSICCPWSWRSRPTLKMPVLGLYDGTELIIKNLIMYEQSAQVQACVTSYMYAMDMLIDSPEDVNRLVESKVLVNHLGSGKNASNLINSMLEGVVIKDFYYQSEFKRLDEYHRFASQWRKFQVEFERKYFSNPWSCIALYAGVIVFFLEVVQTICAVLDSRAA